MNRLICICVALFLGVLNFAHAQAGLQSSPQGSPQDVPTLSETPLPMPPLEARDRAEGLIDLDVMVTDAGGKPAIGLTRSDFRLLEDGREQKILSFQAFTGRGAGTEPPVKILLLVDTLEIPPDVERDERNAVLFYLRQNNGNLARPTSVFELSKTGLWTVTHPSADGKELARQLEHNDLTLVRRAGAGQIGAPGPQVFSSAQAASQGVRSPQEYALRALGQIAAEERRQPGRKLLLWVGPGWGMGTGAMADMRKQPDLFPTICWFSDLLREAHLVLYSFAVKETDARGQLYKDYLDGVRSPHQASLMNLYRKVLAIQSGGRVVDESSNLEQEIESCIQEDGGFYRISFDPFRAEQLDEYHDLKVEVNEPDLHARTNSGFYDEPYYSVDQIPPLKRVSLEELRKILELDESDAAKAGQLVGLELTERLSERRLTSMYAIAHGKKTRQELRILADASAFLDPPADEILHDPPPDSGRQQRMLSMTSTYLKTTIHKLPDLFAQRSTMRYQESPMYLEGDKKYQPLHGTDSWTTTIRYRNGSEVAEAKPPKRNANDPQLFTYGVFGPALMGLLDAIEKEGALTWVRWEQGAHGRLAVFRYIVPTDKSLRPEWLCCTPDGDGRQAFQRYAGYHEEIGIDPESGAILRLALQTDMLSTTPSSRSDIMIEYGPVDIGGTTYICPQRSVSIMRARSVRVRFEWDQFFRSYGPYATMLNDISFDRYHVFRTNSRVLTGFNATDK